MASHSAETPSGGDMSPTYPPPSLTFLQCNITRSGKWKRPDSSDPASENLQDDDDTGHAGRKVMTPQGTFNLKNVYPVLTMFMMSA
jgi:hypothetical protein